MRFPSCFQRGGALVESAVALGAVLLVGLTAVEIMHWQMTRQLVQVALTEAARAGAVDHARPASIARAFEAALLPRYAAPGGESARARLDAHLARVAERAGMPAWRMWIVQPSAAAYDDFREKGLPLPAEARGLPALRNDYQAEQHDAHRSRWPQGRGPKSGINIFEANMLHIRLAYLVEPMVPALRSVLQIAAGLTGESCSRRALSAGLLPLRLDIEMDMQSHPVRWPAAHGVSPEVQSC
jgi:hypothetical protein